MNEIPLPIWVAAFSVLFGAAVTTVVSNVRTKRATNQATMARAAEIVGTGAPVTIKEARQVVNTNATLQRAVDALQTCNTGLEAELRVVKDELAGAKNDLVAALKRITSLETALDEMARLRDNKRQRVTIANRDETGR